MTRLDSDGERVLARMFGQLYRIGDLASVIAGAGKLPFVIANDEREYLCDFDPTPWGFRVHDVVRVEPYVKDAGPPSR